MPMKRRVTMEDLNNLSPDEELALKKKSNQLLFDGITEPRFCAVEYVSEFAFGNASPQKVEEAIKRNIARSLAGAIHQSEKIVIEKRELPMSENRLPEEEFRTELYVFTPDELDRLISNVRRDEQERFIPKS